MLGGTLMYDKTGLSSPKPVMSLPWSVLSLSLLHYSVCMSFSPFTAKCTAELGLDDHFLSSLSAAEGLSPCV